MELNLERQGEHHYIRSVSESGIRIGDEYYRGTVLLSAEELRSDWPPASVEELQELHLQAVLDLRPEVVLIGTGKKQVFLQPELMDYFYRTGVGVEVMSTQAACRTFNVLVSEGRNVVAALMGC